MKITNVRTVIAGFRKKHPQMQRGFALVRVETDTGLVGWGEASTNYGHSYPTVVRTIIDDVLARNLVGKDPCEIRQRTQEMHVLLDGYFGWDGVTAQVIGAVEIALWDIFGKQCGQPICRLLGGRPTAIPLYGTGTTMFDATTDWYAHHYDKAVAHGFRALKVRLGTDPKAAIARVAAVREHLGPDKLVMVDAYWGYGADDALALARKLERYDIYFFEEPAPQYQLAGLRRLCARSPIPIALGERVYSPSQFQLMAEQEVANIFQPDATICGGIAACMNIAAIARAHDIQVIPHVGSLSAIGTAANLHWAAAAGCALYEYDIDPYLPLRDEILKKPLFALDDIRDGVIHVPDGPGLGIEIDEEAFARFPFVSGDAYAEIFPDHETARSRRIG